MQRLKLATSNLVYSLVFPRPIDKVVSVRAFTDSTPLYEVAFRTTTTLEHFTPVTVEEVDKLIGNLSARSGAVVADEGSACVDLTNCVVVAE